MNKIIEGMTGMNKMTDQVIASDMLASSKTGIKEYAAALAEAATPSVRATLMSQFNDAVTIHNQLSDYMMARGWYDAYNPNNQIKMDMQQSTQTLNQLK